MEASDIHDEHDPYAARGLVDRPDAELLAELGRNATADISDSLVALGVRNHIVRGVRPLTSASDATARLCGCAVTLDFVPVSGIHDFAGAPFFSSEVIRRMSPGDVLVMSAKGSEHAFWGGHMARRAIARGIAGGVVDGCIRDRLAIREAGLTVFALGVTPETLLDHYEAVEYNKTIECGGASVTPGDVVVGDDDGVVVVPRSLLADLVVELRRRVELETWMSEADTSDVPAHTVYSEILRRRERHGDDTASR
jgi:5-oxopent-3-ene-1,2,5-tricarboxylate decarboxylase / 2-hydroxyhepta-2,4-diene-1,7-dioate isomerase